jgi:chromosome segregation ATPase
MATTPSASSSRGSSALRSLFYHQHTTIRKALKQAKPQLASKDHALQQVVQQPSQGKTVGLMEELLEKARADGDLARARLQVAEEEAYRVHEAAKATKAALRKAEEQANAARAEIVTMDTALHKAEEERDHARKEAHAARAKIAEQEATNTARAKIATNTALRKTEEELDRAREQANAALAKIATKDKALHRAKEQLDCARKEANVALTEIATKDLALRKAKEQAKAARAEIARKDAALDKAKEEREGVNKDVLESQMSRDIAEYELKKLQQEMARIRLNQGRPSASPRGDYARTCRKQDEHGLNSQSPREYRGDASPPSIADVGRAFPQAGLGCPLGAIVQLGLLIESGSPSCKDVARARLVKILWLLFRTWAHSFRLLRFPEIATSDHATIRAIRQQLEVQIIFVAKWDQILSKK